MSHTDFQNTITVDGFLPTTSFVTYLDVDTRRMLSKTLCVSEGGASNRHSITYRVYCMPFPNANLMLIEEFTTVPAGSSTTILKSYNNYYPRIVMQAKHNNDNVTQPASTVNLVCYRY